MEPVDSERLPNGSNVHAKCVATSNCGLMSGWLQNVTLRTTTEHRSKVVFCKLSTNSSFFANLVHFASFSNFLGLCVAV
jgi:hypothetical protein